MYYVFCDDNPLMDSRDEDLALISPKLSLVDNNAGSFDFTVAPGHPHYNDINRWTSKIKVLQDDEEIFIGRITEEREDFYKRKSFHCEGELAFLNDTIQEPHEYHNLSIRGYLEALISAHNEKVGTNKQFEVGVVTVTDDNDSIYKYTNWETTMEVIKSDLVDKYGGHIRVRNENGTRYIDYLKDYPRVSEQVIRFGINLLEFSKNFDASDICTVVIPLGAKLDESPIDALEAYTTIESVNNGLNYIENTSGVQRFGRIEKIVKWDNVRVPANLKRKAEDYLANLQYDDMILEISAVDLHSLNVDTDAIRLLDEVRAVSDIHGMDRYFPVTELKISLDNPSQSNFKLGALQKTSLSTRTQEQNNLLKKKLDELPTASSIVNEATDNASQLIHSALNGHVVTRPDEILIMDTDDVETARKVWRWNLNGLGHSSTGYDGEYGLAMTMDGQIVGSKIIGNSISADKIDISYRNEVENQINTAEDNSTAYTDNRLIPYWTAEEVQTQIRNTSDAITLSAKETAMAYTDNRLENYATSADVKIKTDAIETEVNKKMNSSEFSTRVQQDAYSVKIAWNNISKYIAFENGELRIYDSDDESTRKIVSKFNSWGEHFYRRGTYIGKIGTNAFREEQYGFYPGLTFDLEYGAKYMSWAAKTSEDSRSYVTKLSWYRDDTIAKKGFHFDDMCYFGNNFRVDEYGGFRWYTGELRLFDERKVTIGSKNRYSCEIKGDSFLIPSDKTIDFYSTLNLHGHGYTNDSDVRMKKSIAPTAVHGLETVNAIDLKEFDWITSGEHQNIGIIAQQLLSFAPELVLEDKSTGQLKLNSGNLVYYCLKAIQELCEKLGYHYEKPIYEDNYSYLDKKTFCLSLNLGKEEIPIGKEEVQILHE